MTTLFDQWLANIFISRSLTTNSAHVPTYLCTYNKDRRQCDQIGRFLKVIFDNFFTNTAQIFGNFFGK